MSFGGKVSGGAYSGSWEGDRPKPSFNPYVFDTGAGKSQRQIVLEGVISLLQRLHVANGGYLQAIEPSAIMMRGKFDDENSGYVLDQLQGRAPGVLVTTGDKALHTAGSLPFQWRGTLDVHVYVLVNSLRSRMTRQTGDVVSAAQPTADPGAFTILEHLEELLIGQRPGGNEGKTDELRPVSETQINVNGEFELWQQTYNLWVPRSINGKRDLTQYLTQINHSSRLAVDATKTPTASTETVVKP